MSGTCGWFDPCASTASNPNETFKGFKLSFEAVEVPPPECGYMPNYDDGNNDPANYGMEMPATFEVTDTEVSGTIKQGSFSEEMLKGWMVKKPAALNDPNAFYRIQLVFEFMDIMDTDYCENDYIQVMWWDEWATVDATGAGAMPMTGRMCGGAGNSYHDDMFMQFPMEQVWESPSSYIGIVLNAKGNGALREGFSAKFNYCKPMHSTHCTIIQANNSSS